MICCCKCHCCCDEKKQPGYDPFGTDKARAAHITLVSSEFARAMLRGFGVYRAQMHEPVHFGPQGKDITISFTLLYEGEPPCA